MRSIFCGNIDFDTRQSELERLFRKYGRVDRVDMKSGFAFVYMEDERDAEDAIRALDRYDFGRKGRRLRVEWTKEERGVRKPASSRRPSANSRPSKTLFVINFDPYNTRTRDLERLFDPYGKILNVRIRRNFAFVQFESQEDATQALEATNMSKLMDRVISVEYAIKDDDDRRNGHSPDRGRDWSPRRRSNVRGRSPSPYRRDRGSPDYGRGRERGSPDYGRGRERGSPDYGRGRESGSPDYSRGRERVSPDYGRGRDSMSPDYGRGRERVSSDYSRGRDGASADYICGRGSSRSPYRRDRASHDHGRGANLSLDGRENMDPQRVPSASPNGRVRSYDYGRDAGPSPRRERERSPRHGRVTSPRERVSPDYERDASPSPWREDRVSPDESPREVSPDAKSEPRNSPGYSGAESPPERYRSRSPTTRERSRS